MNKHRLNCERESGLRVDKMPNAMRALKAACARLMSTIGREGEEPERIDITTDKYAYAVVEYRDGFTAKLRAYRWFALPLGTPCCCWEVVSKIPGSARSPERK